MALEFFSRSRHLPVAEQAAEWLVEFESGPLDEMQRRAFITWLKRSPLHVEEFLQISALREGLGHAPALREPLEQLLAQAQDTVVRLSPDGPEPSVAGRGPRRMRMAAAAAVLALVSGGILAALVVQGKGEKVYRTGFGEQRTIPLADGTVLALNTASEVRVHLGKTQRRAKLVAGEVMFDVAKDAARPFVVAAGPMDIHVVGTRFNVYRQDARTTLTVLEGKVDVVPAAAVVPDSSAPLRRVEAGSQIVVAASGELMAPPRSSVERAAAWTTRRVIFDNEPLSSVLAEFNRYNSRRMLVADPALAQRKVSGVFKVHDIDVLIAFLEQQHDIRIRREGDELHIAPVN